MFLTRRLSSKIILQVILTIMVVPYLFPLIAMVQESLSGQGFGNYRAVWAVGVVPEFFRNSAIIAGGVIIIVYCLTMLAAYGFSKLHIRGREIYFWMMIAALTLPEVVLLTPEKVVLQVEVGPKATSPTGAGMVWTSARLGAS